MQEKKHWSSEEETFSMQNDLINNPENESGLLEELVETETNRRDFLKTLGFSLGAASLAASCSIHERNSIPYVERPEDITPGTASYYASVFAQGGDYVSILVKNRDGRPIKIESNPNSVISQGGTSALAQASIVGLYDSNRHKAAQIGGRMVKWSDFDKEVTSKLEEMKGSGKKIALVTPTIMSPSTSSVIFEFTTKYPNIEHVTIDPISYTGLIDATEKGFGVATLPDYKFENADLILSIGADFLCSWGNSTEYTKGYSKNRKLTKENPVMSRHIHVESVPSTSSGSCDIKYIVSPSQEARFIADLYNALTTGSSSDIPSVNAVKDELIKAKNSGKRILIVNGSNDANVQTLTYAVNQSMGAIGSTIFVGKKVNYFKGTQRDYEKLVNGLKSGDYKGIICLDSNPAYTLPNNEEISNIIKKMEFSLSFSDKIDETTELCKYIAPNNNYLESWNDYEPKEGVYAIGQPVIRPLFHTRQAQESMLTWMGKPANYYDYIKNTAQSYKTGLFQDFIAFWEYTLQKGESVSDSYNSSSSSSFSGDASSALGKVKALYPKSELEVKVYSSVYGDGSMSDNPYVQELPDPVSRVTWGNYFLAHPALVERLNATPDLTKKSFKVITATINGKQVSLPVFPTAGIADNTLGIKYGFGRTKTSNTEYNNGYNAMNILAPIEGHLSNIALNAKVSPSNGDSEKLATVQSYFRLNHMGLGGEKTRDLIKETTLDEYKQNPEAGNTIVGKGRKEWIEHHLVTLYPKQVRPGHSWGMAIDLNSCVGCGSCVVACNIENNVPVVGKNEVYRSHDMHWLRIDRYHTGDVDNPDVTFQPMLCQHCDNAPCENVCPVNATNHSSEGYNQMAYNRCIGTRYCANNCPYKVRRFNWFDYTGSDSFGPGNDQDTLKRTDPIERMVLNPDVVTRSRGVIEKCSFCVQKIQVGKLNAKKENRELKDGDIVPACQSACNTGAIVFGDKNDPESQVAKLMSNERAFGVVEEIYTGPAVNYLTKVRNRDSKKHS